jgi:fumarylacetoacetase
VLDLGACSRENLLNGSILSSEMGKNALESNDLNALGGLGPAAWKELRQTLQRLLSADEGLLRDDADLRGRLLTGVKEVKMQMPMTVGDYTDFYSSREHASNVGTMFGRDPPLMPNWGQLPVGYHGRSSSVVISGTPVTRPRGLVLPKGETTAVYKPCSILDYELEMGFFIGTGNDLGTPITCDDASKHILGLVLVNDWSARDIQKFEYVPLGPFTAKNFATSVSPWVVSLEALDPFSRNAPEQTLAPVADYLTHSSHDRKRKTYDIHLEVAVSSSSSSSKSQETITTKSNFKHLYWTIDQMLAHHTVTGCNTRSGDLLATGTITGSREDPMSFGSLLEKTWAGTKTWPLHSSNSNEPQQRKYLEDGDLVTMRGHCQNDEGKRIGFGQVTGAILPCK